jgi:sialic acid synthase SpsE
MMMIREMTLGGFRVGPNHPPLFFAEIGSFFNGRPEPARELIQRIIACRDAVPEQPVVLKTEILDDPEICLPGDTMETYASKGGGVKQENYRELIERKVMKTEDYIPLFKMCRDANIPFVVSVYDMKAASFAKEHGAAGLKIASSNLTHVPLIRFTAGLGLPMVIDTGRATIAEVHRAVDTARKGGCFDIIVQHSPEGHPAPAKSHNLRIMQTYMHTFGLPAGLSDHYTGVEMLYLSVALGASVLEKGIYFDPNELDQDIAHSMGIDDLPRVLRMVHDSFIALGRFERDPQLKIDWVIGTSQRQCLVANRNLQAGDPINLETVRFAFPMKGIPVEYWDLVTTWRIAAAVEAGKPIRWEHVAAATV